MKRALAMTALAAACTLAAVAAFSGSARATYGGATNGRIAFGMNVNGNTDVYTVAPERAGPAPPHAPTPASTRAPPTRPTAGGSPTARARAAALSRCGR